MLALPVRRIPGAARGPADRAIRRRARRPQAAVRHHQRRHRTAGCPAAFADAGSQAAPTVRGHADAGAGLLPRRRWRAPGSSRPPRWGHAGRPGHPRRSEAHQSGGAMTSPQQSAHPATTRRGQGVTADGEFYMPTRVFFGRGVADQAGARAAGLGMHRVLLVTDPGVQAAGLTGPVNDNLIAAGLEVVVFAQVEPNPRDTDCLAGAELAADVRADGFAAIGGGSAIDTAKCIALLRTNGGHPRDWEDFGALRDDPLPVLALPTTAGTGSEVSPSAVITDTARKKKLNLFDMRNCPEVALVDPDLTLSCPPAVTAAAGGRLRPRPTSKPGAAWPRAASPPGSPSASPTSRACTAWPRRSAACTATRTGTAARTACRRSWNTTCR